MKNLISYIIGAFLIIMSFQSFGENAYLNFALFFVAGLICFPVVLDKININFISKYYIPIVVFLFILGANLNKSDVKEEDVVASENDKKLQPKINEFPDFKYEIIGNIKGFSGNETGKNDVVFVKVNSCDDAELKYLQKLIQNDNRFPPIIKSGNIEKNVLYEFKIFLVKDIKQEVDLKNVKAIYEDKGDIVVLNDYLRKNTKGFCAMMYKMWDLKTYPTYEENFEIFMRP
jgi:hypothetical protein